MDPPKASDPTPGEAVTLTNAKWSVQPRIEAPAKAIERGRSGKVRAQCLLQTDGSVSGCKIVSESPKNYGFGQAVLRGIAGAKLQPYMENGVPVAKYVIIPFRFDLDF